MSASGTHAAGAAGWRPGVWAVLPVKDRAAVKQRLAPALSREERIGLLSASARDVLSALAGCSALAGVLVVTRDPFFEALADEFGARCLREPSNDGHTAAVTRGALALRERGIPSALALPADIPLLQPADVARLIAAHDRAPRAVTIAPSLDELGSNGVLLTPPDVIPLRFGDASFRPHMQRAEEAGVAPRALHLRGFDLDIDRPEDLVAFAAEPSDTAAYRFLVDSGILARLISCPVTRSPEAAAADPHAQAQDEGP